LKDYLPWNERESRFEYCAKFGDTNDTTSVCTDGWVYDKYAYLHTCENPFISAKLIYLHTFYANSD
jgi:hypothetical protein